NRHRAVDVDREPRQRLLLEGPGQQIQEQLGPADREDRHEDLGPGVDSLADDLTRFQRRLVQRPVVAVAVRRFHDHDVRVLEGHGIGQQRSPTGPEVAGEDHGSPAAVLLPGEVDTGRAENVAGVDEAGRDSGRDLYRGVVAYGPEQAAQPLDVLLAVQGLEERLARALALLVLALEIADLEAVGVAHDHPSQVEGLRGAEDRAGVAPPGEGGEPADVVEMGMADDDGVEVPARESRDLSVLGDRSAAALIEPAVDQYAGALGGDLECGTGHVSGRSVEMDLHRRPSW